MREPLITLVAGRGYVIPLHHSKRYPAGVFTPYGTYRQTVSVPD